jgi:Cyclin-dependent kinase inhibitor 3 (CDKN3)
MDGAPPRSTNTTMIRPVNLPEALTRGDLYLCAMPGRREPLDQFLREIETANVRHILCLVADDEIARKSPTYLDAIQGHGIPATLWRSSIPDYGTPESIPDLELMLDLLWEQLDAGESLVIHCAGGHGRTGVVATLLLMRMGLPFEEAAGIVGQAGSGPDMPDQEAFLRRWGGR